MKRLIAALDVPERSRAIALAQLLAPEVAMVKIGLEAFTAHGPDLVRAIVATGVDVFLDLKVHDIPRTAAAAAREAAALGARLVTVHAAGGSEMIHAAKDAAGARCQIIAVTVLTSLDDAGLASLGLSGGTKAVAARWGEVAMQSGADGLVCSAHELADLSAFGGVRVVPGVRPQGQAAGDQKRVATPHDAVRWGATWIVVGRPIVEARDPLAAARAVNGELA